MKGAVFSLFILISSLGQASVLDSIGIKTKGDKKYIIHQVTQGETFYSLSKRYNLSVEDIKVANNSGETLSIGQELYLPIKSKETTTPTAEFQNIHVVGSQETLFSISRRYKVSVQDLKKWNSLESNDIKIGQKLIFSDPEPQKAKQTHTVESKETLYSLARKYGVSVEAIRKANDISEQNTISIGQTLIIPIVEQQIPEKKESLVTTKSMIKVKEHEAFSKTKAQCFHRTAAKGTVIKVDSRNVEHPIYLIVVGNEIDDEDVELIINEKAKEALKMERSVLIAKVSVIE